MEDGVLLVWDNISIYALHIRVDNSYISYPQKTAVNFQTLTYNIRSISFTRMS